MAIVEDGRFDILHRTTPGGMQSEIGRVRHRMCRRGRDQLRDQLVPGHWLLVWDSHTRPDGTGWETEAGSLSFVLEAGEDPDPGVVSPP